jgi:hypothetical protein
MDKYKLYDVFYNLDHFELIHSHQNSGFKIPPTLSKLEIKCSIGTKQHDYMRDWVGDTQRNVNLDYKRTFYIFNNPSGAYQFDGGFPTGSSLEGDDDIVSYSIAFDMWRHTAHPAELIKEMRKQKLEELGI